MQLNPGAFNTFLRGIGQVVSWRPSVACPCLNEHSGAAEQNCPLCRGKGHIWSSGIEGVVGVTRQAVEPEWKDFGNYEAGDMTATVGSDSPLYDMGRFDRVELRNSTDRFSRVLQRGVNDAALDVPVVKITRVVWRSLDRTRLIEGALPTWNPVTRALTFPATGVVPDPGQQYTLVGEKFDEYYVYQMLPSDRNEHQGAPLPKRVQMRKFDLFGR